VSIVPSVMWKMPGNLVSQGLLVAGTYWRALASTAATVGIWAATPAEWMSNRRGQVDRSQQRGRARPRGVYSLGTLAMSFCDQQTIVTAERGPTAPVGHGLTYSVCS